jgi:hypothetical protein
MKDKAAGIFFSIRWVHLIFNVWKSTYININKSSFHFHFTSGKLLQATTTQFTFIDAHKGGGGGTSCTPSKDFEKL